MHILECWVIPYHTTRTLQAHIGLTVGEEHPVLYFYWVMFLKNLLFVVLLDLCAVGLWAVQFHQKLQHNVMSREDRDNQWSSANMAHYGYSFW
jgi:hypothetical protein